MSKTIHIKLASIRYAGKSIGADIRVEIDIFNRTAKFEDTLKKGGTAHPNLELGSILIDEKSTAIPATIRVTERDFLFDDIGSSRVKLVIDPRAAYPQQSIHTVEVREFRGYKTKSVARFEVVIEASITEEKNSIAYQNRSIPWWKQWKEIKPYSYRGISGKENYNRYDTIIRKIVAQWNKEFCDDIYPPDEPLDPNIVKAILYQESRIGYDKNAGVNVMQVGNDGDPSLKTLRGELKEYWIRRGRLLQLTYAKAKVTTVEESITWGTRWLYHKAQGSTEDNRRFWRSWKEAVRRYGPGTKKYADDVWGIYTNGIKREGKKTIRLWLFGLFLFGGFSLWGQAQFPLRASSLDEQSIPTDSYAITEMYAPFDPTLTVSIVEREKDWWESLDVHRVHDGKKLPIVFTKEPGEQSVLSAWFTELDGMRSPFLAVYGETHAGHGSFYLYEVKDNRARLVLETPAVDKNYDMRFAPKNGKIYSHTTCGEIFDGGFLRSSYADINADGFSDVTLSGIQIIACENENGDTDDNTQSEVARITIVKQYIWNDTTRVFDEIRKKPNMF